MSKASELHSLPKLDVSWMAQAACRGMDTSIFFPDYEKGYNSDNQAKRQEALAICGRCPVRTECLDYAMASEPRSRVMRNGVYGGTDEVDRQKLGRKRKTRSA